MWTCGSQPNLIRSSRRNTWLDATEDLMTHTYTGNISRRGFCLCCLGVTTVAATGAWLSPSQVFAQARNVVDAMREDAGNAAIGVHKLRGKISALVGSGGNIAVLSGPEGKVLVDSGITASRPRILEALAGLGEQPITHSSTRTGTSITPTATNG
jgi:hypothetical protein